MPKTDRIRRLNDQLRTTFKGGKIAITPGVIALGDLPTILQQLKEFDAFDEHGDLCRDFGAFHFSGSSPIAGKGPLLFFQISHYDKELMFASPDPTIPEVTTSVLTILLAEEY